MHRTRFASERRSVGASERRSVGASERSTRVSGCSSAEVQCGNPTRRVRGAILPCMTPSSQSPNAEPNRGAAKPDGRTALSYSCVQNHVAPLQTPIGKAQRQFAPSHSPVAVLQNEIAPLQFHIIAYKTILHRRTAALHHRTFILQRRSAVLHHCNFILQRCKMKLLRLTVAVTRYYSTICLFSSRLPRWVPPRQAYPIGAHRESYEHAR